VTGLEAALGPAVIVGHDVVARPLGGRSGAVAVEVDGVPRAVVRAPFEPGDAPRQRAVLDALAGAGDLAGRVPVTVPWPGDVIATAWLEGRGADGDPPPGDGALRDLGGLLRVVHGLAAPPAACGPGRTSPPWVTRLHRPTPRRLAWSSAAVVSLVRRVQADAALCDGLDALAAAWTPSGLAHGDARLANVLLGADGRTALVDWEAAHPGDGRADLGWVAGDLLAPWAAALGDGDEPEAAALLRTHRRLDRALARVGVLLAGHGSPGDAATVLRWAGARLLQAAAERCQDELFPDRPAGALLRAARVVTVRADELAAGAGPR
jgi:aminoglycoside phosphotransferase (APT) family kinase protein